MYTVFISDDEASIREGLKCIMDWESLGFTICGEASNGSDALLEILAKQPNLVLMDIRMPKMHGIDVIIAAREQGFTGKCILLSGYSDFGYAQTAIRYGVDFYLTKPIDEDELLPALKTVKDTLDKENLNDKYVNHYKLRAKNAILQDLLANTSEGSANLSQSDIKQLNLDAEMYQVVIYENFNRKIADLAYNFADLLKITNKGNSTFEYIKISAMDIILLKGGFALKKFQDFLNHYEKNSPQKGSPLDSLFLAYGQPVRTLNDIHLSYCDALSLINRRFFCLQGQHTLGYEELPHMNVKDNALTNECIQEYANQLTDHLQTFNRKKVAETLYQLNEYLYNVNDSISSIKLFLVDLYLQIKEKLNHIYNTINIPFPTNSTIIDLIEKKYYLYEIIRFFSEQFEMIMNATGNSSRDSIIDDILYYIEHNYQSNIKLESIAPLFGYNSAYLGKIFSKTVGVNFNYYVDYIRINHSKELLLQNKLKVYEISEVIGYKNVDYFHKKFKKYVGVSPAEFRKSTE
ncbi:MAG TPA: response regulator [Mobilitalea sp.]|nr:response regulator [Mobilitalea sp.]